MSHKLHLKSICIEQMAFYAAPFTSNANGIKQTTKHAEEGGRERIHNNNTPQEEEKEKKNKEAKEREKDNK